jgi:RNA polymerase sigma-70 factor (ECF subfamily)
MELAAEPAPPTAARCEELFAARGVRIKALATRLLGQDADDGVQEVFTEACRSLPSFRGEARLTTWFHRLAIRVLCAYRRRRERRADREVAEADVELRLSPAALRNYADAPLERLAREERRARVLAAIDSLSQPLREVLLLRGEGLGYREIADSLAIPLGTVKSRTAAAMVQLAERLHGEQETR